MAAAEVTLIGSAPATEISLADDSANIPTVPGHVAEAGNAPIEEPLEPGPEF